MKKMFAVKITGSGQMTLPAEVRRKLGVQSGDTVQVVMDESAVTVEPVKWTVDTLMGSLKPSRPIPDVEAAIREAKDEHVDRFMQKYLAE